MKQGTQNWCSGATQRDGWEGRWKEGSGWWAQSQHTLLRSVLSRSVGESTDEVVVVDLVFSMRAHSDELQVRDRRLLSAPQQSLFSDRPPTL